MSDDYLKLVPDDPDFVPDASSINKAIIFLGSIFDKADDIKTSVFEALHFIDPGSNLESVSCSSCSSDILDWWSIEMDKLFKDQFSNLFVITPCCKSTLSMNDLDYHFQAGFARFVIEIKNPSISGMLDDKVINQVGLFLGCKVRQIMAHY